MVRLAYRCLLFAFPAESRARVGADLVDTLVADLDETSAVAAVGRFFANAVDLVSSGVAERRERRRGVLQSVPPERKPTLLDELRRMLGDARLALRSFRKSPGFTAAAVLSIALGIGLNTTIFSVVNAVLLRPVPGRDPGRLVTIFTSSDNEPLSSTSYPDFADIAQRNSTLDGVMAHTLMFAGVEHGDATRLTVGELVTSNYFDVLGVPLARGRSFEAGSDRIGNARTAVISDRMWKRDFGSGDAVGRTLTIHGRTYTIAGIAPAGFNGFMAGVAADLWLPVGAVDDVEPVGITDMGPSPGGSNRNERRGQRYLFLTGRLKPGVSVEAARANVASVMDALAAEYPVSNKNRRSSLMPANAVRVHPGVDSELTPAAGVLMGAVAVVLLVACSNIASLLLARAAARAKEIALRVAIGASRGRLVRQLIVESLVLSLSGGAAGLVLAVWLAALIARVQPPFPVAISFDFSPDLRVFGFTLALAVLTGLVFGLVPAIRASKPDLVPALKGDASSGRPRRFGLRSMLVAGQMALSTVLLVLAGLLLRSFVAAVKTDVKFDAGRVVYAAINGSKQFADRDASTRFFAEARRRLERLPGVESVSLSDRLPFSLTNNTFVVEIPGMSGPATSGGFSVDNASVGSDYFATLGVPIVSGRAIDSRDAGPNSAPVAVINQTAARKFWPQRNPVGEHFHVRNDGDYTIIGVSADHPVRAIGEAPRPFFQTPLERYPIGFANVIVRARGSAADLTPAVRRTLLDLDPSLAFMGLEPMTGLIDATLFPARAAMFLLGAFGGLALVLAVIGLYGVISFTVARQTRDIGIRMALGADRSRVVGGVVGGGLTLVGAGAAAGLVLAALAAQVVAGFLVGVSPLDPVSYGAALGTLGAAGLVAAFVPARRAAAINPTQALRTQ